MHACAHVLHKVRIVLVLKKHCVTHLATEVTKLGENNPHVFGTGITGYLAIATSDAHKGTSQ